MAKRNRHLLAIEDHLQGIRSVMFSCNARQLRSLRTKIHELGVTNCWWYLYHAKPLLIETVEEVSDWKRGAKKRGRQ